MAEHVHEVSKRGEWYTVAGSVDGRKVSIDVPANQVDTRSRAEAISLFKRGLRSVEKDTP